MNRKQFVLGAVGGGVLGIAAIANSEAQKTAPRLAVAVLPSGFQPEMSSSGTVIRRPVIRFVSAPQHINVALRNLSSEPLSVWNEENSWGFYNLTLEVTGLDGKPLPKPILVRRGPVEWSNNGPGTSELLPGETIVREMTFVGPIGSSNSGGGPTNAYGYFDFPLSSRQMFRKIRLRVVYSVPSDPFAKRQKVWTGRITSEERDYILRQEPGI